MIETRQRLGGYSEWPLAGDFDLRLADKAGDTLLAALHGTLHNRDSLVAQCSSIACVVSRCMVDAVVLVHVGGLVTWSRVSLVLQ
jgi:hypothetical protein